MKRSVEQKLYRKSVNLRDSIFRPIATAMTFLRITPFMVTILGFVSMFLFALALPHNEMLSLFFLALSVLFDLLDGVLARYQNKATDRGKFADMVFDNLSFTVFIIGLVFAGLLSALPAVLIAYFMLLSKVMRSIYNAFSLDTDWRFKAVAGFLPNFAVGLCYILFIIYSVFGINLFNDTFSFIGIALAVDAAVFYLRVTKK